MIFLGLLLVYNDNIHLSQQSRIMAHGFWLLVPFVNAWSGVLFSFLGQFPTHSFDDGTVKRAQRGFANLEGMDGN
jgi:hypothetical protein